MLMQTPLQLLPLRTKGRAVSVTPSQRLRLSSTDSGTKRGAEDTRNALRMGHGASAVARVTGAEVCAAAVGVCVRRSDSGHT